MCTSKPNLLRPIRPAFKNRYFESKDKMRKNLTQLSLNVEIKKRNLHKINLVTFQN